MKVKIKDLTPGSWLIYKGELYINDRSCLDTYSRTTACVRFEDGKIRWLSKEMEVTFVKSVVVEYEV